MSNTGVELVFSGVERQFGTPFTFKSASHNILGCGASFHLFHRGEIMSV
jgi:hypothetical protein